MIFFLSNINVYKKKEPLCVKNLVLSKNRHSFNLFDMFSRPAGNMRMIQLIFVFAQNVQFHSKSSIQFPIWWPLPSFISIEIPQTQLLSQYNDTIFFFVCRQIFDYTRFVCFSNKISFLLMATWMGQIWRERKNDRNFINHIKMLNSIHAI